MELDNSFTVPVPPEQAWDVLLDVERIAPCMPGATVDDVDGDVVNGRIRIKVGPVSLTYRGTAKFTERDSDARTVALEASGKETRGAGTASATVRASLAPDPVGTLVTMHTDMNVTGRPAQFGRGVMVEVGGKLVDQFAANLAKLLAGDQGGDASAAAAAGESAPSSVAEAADTAVGDVAAATATTATAADFEQEDSLNLIRLVGPAILKRAVPVIIAAVGVTLVSRLLWRRRGRRTTEEA
jgi:carbon monoxide dehydrogenase subunit G